jgi:hypothetical protein
MEVEELNNPENSRVRLWLGPGLIVLGFILYIISSSNAGLNNSIEGGAEARLAYCDYFSGNECDIANNKPSTFGLWIAALGFWIWMGHLTGKMASTKGRTYSSFFWLGFFLPVIGLIVASTLSPLAPKTVVLAESTAAVNQINNGPTKKCPFCAELIQIEAVFCKHCRNNLEK